MDEDDFGDLYGDQAPDVPSMGTSRLQSSFSFFDDDIDDDKKSSPAEHTVLPGPPVLRNSQPSPELQVPADQPVHRDSDEDDDMLLLGYNSKAGYGGSKPQASADNTVNEEILKLPESASDENADDDGLISPPAVSSIRAAAVGVPGIAPKQEVEVAGLSSLNGLNISDLSHQSIPGLTIPGIATTVNAPFFDMGDNGDAAQHDWEPVGLGGKPSNAAETDFAIERADDWDSDSEDDLRIVLNNEYPYYGPREKQLAGRQEGLSEDEDDEDLIIFAGGELTEEGEEQLLQPPESQALLGDGPVHPQAEKQTGVEDGKGQPDKAIPGIGTPGQAGRGYGYSYNSPYKYVRAGSAGMYGTGATPPGQNLGGRMGLSKGVGGRGDWRGSGRGSSGLQYSGSSSYEYTLPPSMTVFDIDLESFEEKAWRQFDVTDYFNFGFDETSWKEYCKQLAQIRLESTIHGKIRVYQSGRSEQEYDPDLPTELTAAAGVSESAERGQQRLESDATASGIRRGYTPMIPYGRPIEVEGGLGDRRPSSDLKKQRLRDSDSVLLIDVIEEEDVEEELLVDEGVEELDGEANKDDMDERQQQEEQEEGEEEEPRVKDPGTFLKAGLGQWDNERRSKFMSDATVSTTDHNRSQGGRPALPLESGKILGEPPPTTRQKTGLKPLDEESRDVDQVCSQSGMRQDVKNKQRIGIFEEDPYVKKQRGKAEHAQRHDARTEEPETGQRASLTPTIIREVHTNDVCPLDGQVESSGGSSKRPRLVSPEASHTASWDNYDLPKLARNHSYRKESRDSGESALDGREGIALHRKKSKSHSEASRENRFKDSKHDFEPRHRKQASILSGHDSGREHYDGHHSDSLQDNRKRPMQDRIEEDVARDASRQWKAREDPHRRGRDEEAERKAYLTEETCYKDRAAERNTGEEYKDAAHQRDGVGSRSDSRRKEEVERRDKQHSRRRDDGKEGYERENRHRETRDYQHREKEVDELHHSERRRKEEHQRRDYAEEGSDHVIKSDREKRISERYGQETADQNVRRKEEQTWKKEKVEDHHRPKARDGSTRGQEDSRQQHKDHQDPLARGHKHEERTPQVASSSRRHDENRTSYGSRLSVEEPRKSQSRDERKDLDGQGKDDKSRRPHEGRAWSTSDREGVPLLEMYERETGKHDRVSDDPRTSEKRLYAEKHRLDAKRSKDADKQAKDPTPQLEDHATASRKRKGASEKNEMANKRKPLEDSLTPRVVKEQPGVTRAHLEESKEPNSSRSGKPHNRVRRSDARDKGSSEDDEGGRRGRSKLERRMSRKDLDLNASERSSVQDSAKKDERSRLSEGSREKQRCEEQKRDIDEDAAKVSSFEEQAANGKVPLPKPDEKGDIIVHKKDSYTRAGEKDRVEELREPSPPKTNLAAKLEKRKERFKVSVEDMDSSRKLDHEERQAVEKDDARHERPPRKRRWASG